MRLGVFGGSFDPPHVGHLIAADDAAAALGLTRILFVPAGKHPLKGDDVEAPADLRLAMVHAATRGCGRFVVDDREIRRRGPSYTADTLNELASEHKGAELFLLVGSDILKELDRWHRVDEIRRQAQIVVMSRAGAELEVSPSLDVEFVRVDVTHIAISSTEIRERVRHGRPFRFLVPPPVHGIIVENSLYQSQDPASSHR